MGSRRRWPHVLLALHCALVLLCVAGPGYAWWGSSARPFVLGLPWSFAWILIWLAATFVAVLAYWRWVERERAPDE
jgi:hypothetical protein